MPAAIDQAANANQIANLEFRDLVPRRGDASDNFMSGHERIVRRAPFVAGHVNVGVADPAIQDVDLHIGGPGIAAFEGERNELACGGMSGVAVRWIVMCFLLLLLQVVSCERPGFCEFQSPAS